MSDRAALALGVLGFPVLIAPVIARPAIKSQESKS